MPQAKYVFVESLAAKVAADAALQEQLRNDPTGALQNLAGSPLQTDPWIYRIVVGGLGLAVLFTIAAAAYLAGQDKKIPDGMIAIGSAAVGALAGLLVPSPLRQ